MCLQASSPPEWVGQQPHSQRAPVAIQRPMGSFEAWASHAAQTWDGRNPPRPWENGFAEDGGLTSAVRLRQGLRAGPGTQARIACSSGPTPMIAITRLML